MYIVLHTRAAARCWRLFGLSQYQTYLVIQLNDYIIVILFV